MEGLVTVTVMRKTSKFRAVMVKQCKFWLHSFCHRDLVYLSFGEESGFKVIKNREYHSILKINIFLNHFCKTLSDFPRKSTAAAGIKLVGVDHSLITHARILTKFSG